MVYSPEELDASLALKAIARNTPLKSALLQTPAVYAALWPAARRFITGETRKAGIETAKTLTSLGYGIFLAYAGENTGTEQACQAAMEELLALSQAVETASLPKETTISFDLSHIGLSVSQRLARDHFFRLVQETKERGICLMVDMEESDKLEAILEVYQQGAAHYPHVGITLAAHLYRTEQDLEALMHLPGKIRLVKGAYQEPEERAMKRGEALDERFLSLIERAVSAQHPLSIATHDQHLLQELERRKWLAAPQVEVEMLYGVRPDLLKQMKQAGYQTRLYLPYGTEWYLYLCHRLAEYPPNIYQALADCVQPSRTQQPTSNYF
ncbi:proline dehydrogenase family protein [Tengunoibacter tsumagoiensis]|uniref:proline dehydrogenase n=1 Tax=Tengunoibacter tsumagoiensis TaxID=2014871 RepID=A0A402A978_9CHLR|nr:proline dehydrogenase family protein [Tengunoibacter tsumagoiensis]GCE15515.1 proline dehydrogenase [Tengunoibacter tsumagoiensis]